MATPSIRVFAVAPNQRFVDVALQTLNAVASVEAAGSTDPRSIKEFAADGPVHAVLVAASCERPAPDQLVAALRPALGDRTAFVLLTQEIAALSEGSPFHGGIRFPVAPPVLLAYVRRSVREVWRAAVDTRAMQAEVELRYVRMQEQNYYEVLGVAPNASVDGVTGAYDELSLQFHPDRLRHLDSEDAREMALTIYVRIGDAYRTLRDPNERLRYEQALKKGEGGTKQAATKRSSQKVQTFADLSDAPNAKKYLVLAQKALIGGDKKMALAHLRFAQTQDEDNGLIARKIEQLDDGG